MKTKSLPVTPRKTVLFAQRMKQLIGTPVAIGLAIVTVGCAGDRHARTAGESVDDSATSNRVQSALGSDTAYKYPDVKVTTFQGRVQLSGFVDKDDQKDRAEEIAKNTAGVKDVKNNIVLK